MIEINELRPHLQDHALFKGVDRLPKGHLRIETGLLYPDGSSIEVFVVEDSPLHNTIKLSDLGQTTAWLLNVQVKPWLSKKRKGLLEDAIQLLGVRQIGGTLELPIKNIDQIPEDIIRLSQACLRVADLTFTRRSSLQTVFTEEVEEVLVDSEVEYTPNSELIGRYGKSIRVDYLAKGKRTESAILGLSSGSASQAHNLANEVFRRWYDLSIPERTEQRVTIFDDKLDVYREEDLRRLGDYSTVVALSERTTIRDLLAA
jgi:hypothetical protein